MDIFTSVIILILATLIQSLMQLSPSVFSLFYHYALGKKSHSKIDDFSLHFILGTETFIVTIFTILYIFVFAIRNQINSPNDLPMWILSGIFIAEAFASFCFYYRHGKTTTLFLSRSAAKSLTLHAQKVKSRSDAFVLGFLSNIAELVFTLPLYLIIILTFLNFPTIARATTIIIYLVVAILPLIFTYIAYRTGHNLAEISRFRLRFKPLIRFSLFLGFILLSIVVIFRSFYYG